MAKTSSITAKYLRSRLDYDPATGVFIWRARSTPPGINDGGWNRRIAGKVAGTVSVQGYRHISIDNKLYRANRLAWLYVYGRFPPRHVDHEDEDRLNDRIANLRPATHAQNLWNHGPNRNNRSGVKGVFWDKKRRRWRAEIAAEGKQIALGVHHTKAAAKAARDEAARKYHGDFAKLARPDKAVRAS